MTEALLPAQPRRRQCASKTRAGCQTCKIRRVKCDEAKPNCQRCISTGRTCDGYRPHGILLSNPKDQQSAAAIIYRVATCIPGTTKEKRGFHYFITNTAAELTGYYTSSFWENLVLQASAAEPSLRHAVVAIASLHEEFSSRALCGASSDLENAGSRFAVSQYMKGVSHLRRSLSGGKSAPLTALMSCILFVCFDHLRGHFDSAMMHLQSGLEILRELESRSKEVEDIAEQSIAPLFTQLSIQSTLYIDTRNLYDKRQFAKQLMNVTAKEPPPIPGAFENLDEARAALNRATDGLFRVFYMCDANQPMSSQPPEVFTTYQTYTAQLFTWDSAFSSFMSSKSHELTALQIRGAALLKIHHTTAIIMARSVPAMDDPRNIAVAANDGEVFARCTNEFQIVLALSRSLIAAAAGQDIQRDGRPAGLTFSTDLGVVAPLYYVCIKCAVVEVREQAIELLGRCRRREGMWDSELSVRMIREFWEMEETHRSLQLEARQDCGVERVALVEAVWLVLGDEMRWEWKWKEPEIT